MDASTTVMIQTMLWTLVAPVSVTLMAMVAALKISPKTEDRPLVAGLGLGAGLLTSFLGISGVPPIPPVDSIGWIPLGLVALLAGMSIVDLKKLPLWVSAAIWTVLAGGGASLVMKPRFEEWEGAVGPLWVLGSALVSLIPFLAMKRAGEKGAPPAMFSVLSIAALGSSGVMGLGGSALLAQILGSIAGGCGAVAILTLWKPQLKVGASAAAGAIFMISSLVLYGHLYAEIDLMACVLAILGPVVALSASKGGSKWRSIGIALGSSIVVAIAAVGLLMIGGEGEEDVDDSPNPYDYYKPSE